MERLQRATTFAKRTEQVEAKQCDDVEQDNQDQGSDCSFEAKREKRVMQAVPLAEGGIAFSRHEQNLKVECHPGDTAPTSSFGASPWQTETRLALTTCSTDQRLPFDESDGNGSKQERHEYTDYAGNTEDLIALTKGDSPSAKVGSSRSSFPQVLHQMLENSTRQGFNDVVSWQPHGRAFLVRNPEQFRNQVLPKYFKHKQSSFQRQLNLYGFLRITRNGPDQGSYYHPLFLRGRPLLCGKMKRIPASRRARPSSLDPRTEPNLYGMPFVEAPAATVAMNLGEPKQRVGPIRASGYAVPPAYNTTAAQLGSGAQPPLALLPCPRTTMLPFEIRNIQFPETTEHARSATQQTGTLPDGTGTFLSREPTFQAVANHGVDGHDSDHAEIPQGEGESNQAAVVHVDEEIPIPDLDSLGKFLLDVEFSDDDHENADGNCSDEEDEFGFPNSWYNT